MLLLYSKLSNDFLAIGKKKKKTQIQSLHCNIKGYLNILSTLVFTTVFSA